jgi:hypothetical protein
MMIVLTAIYCGTRASLRRCAASTSTDGASRHLALKNLTRNALRDGVSFPRNDRRSTRPTGQGRGAFQTSCVGIQHDECEAMSAFLTLGDVASSGYVGIECRHCMHRALITAEALSATRGDSCRPGIGACADPHCPMAKLWKTSNRRFISCCSLTKGPISERCRSESRSCTPRLNCLRFQRTRSLRAIAFSSMGCAGDLKWSMSNSRWRDPRSRNREGT